MAEKEEPTMDTLMFADYVHARRFLKAYSDRLRENNAMRSGDEREWAETVYQVTAGMVDQLDEAFEDVETKMKFNRIVGKESWDGL